MKSESHVALDSLRPKTTLTRDYTDYEFISQLNINAKQTHSNHSLYDTLNLLGALFWIWLVRQLFFSTFAFTYHIFEPLWFQRFSFVAWKRRFDENGASLPSPGLELNLLDLICSIFDTTVAMMLEKLAWRLKQFSYEEGSLLLRIRFSSTKFAQRKIWPKLHDKNCSN